VLTRFHAFIFSNLFIISALVTDTFVNLAYQNLKSTKTTRCHLY